MADTHEERQRARAYAHVTEFMISKLTESNAYLENLHMFLQERCATIRHELARRAAAERQLKDRKNT